MYYTKFPVKKEVGFSPNFLVLICTVCTMCRSGTAGHVKKPV